MSDFGYFGVMTSTSTQNMSMSQYLFILSYCKRLEEHFGTKISASSQTVLKLPLETYHKIPSSRGDIVVPGQHIRPCNSKSN